MELSHDQILVNQIKQHLIQQNMQRLKGMEEGEESDDEEEAHTGEYIEAYHDEDEEEREKEEYDEQGRLLTLSLRNTGLRQIPPEIWEFTSLQKLDVGHNQLRTVPAEIGQHARLQKNEQESPRDSSEG